MKARKYTGRKEGMWSVEEHERKGNEEELTDRVGNKGECINRNCNTEGKNRRHYGAFR
jgi:hypothetical protein